MESLEIRVCTLQDSVLSGPTLILESLLAGYVLGSMGTVPKT